MFQTSAGTLTGTALGLPLVFSGGGLLVGMAVQCVIRNAGLVGVVVVTINGADSVGAWQKTPLTLNLPILGLGARVFETLCEVSVGAVTADFTFIGVLGTPVIEYAMGVF